MHQLTNGDAGIAEWRQAAENVALVVERLAVQCRLGTGAIQPVEIPVIFGGAFSTPNIRNARPTTTEKRVANGTRTRDP
jgi:hypothetical protein